MKPAGVDAGVLSRLAHAPILEREAGDVHPSWIEAALSELPARARVALTDPETPTDVWLQRLVTAELPPNAPSALPVDAANMLTWLIGVGADQIAFALGGDAARVPSLTQAIARINKSPRRDELGPKRAAIARCSDASLDDELAFVRVACRALAPHVATNRLAQLQLSRALPRPIGLVALRELLAYADVSLDQVPSWSALCAR